jgi:hypothetical protein
MSALTEADIAARFAGKFAVVGDCWEWQLGKESGYGRVRVDRRLFLVHRLVLSLVLGRPLAGDALHSCDNPPCLRPAHLHEGTHQQNMRERGERGRTATGERHGKARLTSAQVTQLRIDREAGRTYRQLAAMYGVSHQSARAITRRATWRNVA